jgi:hypothetical protein
MLFKTDVPAANRESVRGSGRRRGRCCGSTNLSIDDNPACLSGVKDGRTAAGAALRKRILCFSRARVTALDGVLWRLQAKETWLDVKYSLMDGLRAFI